MRSFAKALSEPMELHLEYGIFRKVWRDGDGRLRTTRHIAPVLLAIKMPPEADRIALSAYRHLRA